MITVEITTTGVEGAIKQFTRFYNKLPEIISDLVKEVGDIAYYKAVQICPYDMDPNRGNYPHLISTLKLETGSDYYSLISGSNEVYWAVFNEYGSSRTPFGPAKWSGIRPFMRPSIYFSLKFIPKKYELHIEEMWMWNNG